MNDFLKYNQIIIKQFVRKVCPIQSKNPLLDLSVPSDLESKIKFISPKFLKYCHELYIKHSHNILNELMIIDNVNTNTKSSRIIEQFLRIMSSLSSESFVQDKSYDFVVNQEFDEAFESCNNESIELNTPIFLRALEEQANKTFFSSFQIPFEINLYKGDIILFLFF